MPDRVYAMTQLGVGDYLLPSNDGKTIWRLSRYREDGSLEHHDGAKVVGWFWRAARFEGTMDDADRLVCRDPEAFRDWDRWREHACLLKTRAEAIQAALEEPCRA